MHREPPATAYLALVGTTFAFGLSYVATKVALEGFSPLLLAMLRFALAGAILVLVWGLTCTAPKMWRHIPPASDTS